MNLNSSVTELKGVGPKKKDLLSNMKIDTVFDLLSLYPRKYQDRRKECLIFEAPINHDVLIVGKVLSCRVIGNPYNKKAPLRVQVTDGSGELDVLFFGGKYLKNLFAIGKEYSFFGKVYLNGSKKQMHHPEFHPLDDEKDYRGILPMYPLTEGLTQVTMRNIMREAQNVLSETEELEEWLPESIVKENKLCSPKYALSHIHFPKDESEIRESRFRMVFEELLILETGLTFIKKSNSSIVEGPVIPENIDLKPFLAQLPFELTESQKKVVKEIEIDLAKNKPMNRLVQGDVGSGKTAVAMVAMYKTVKAGFQAAMMAPTELLAKQHYSTLKLNFEPLGVKVELLTSGLKLAERKELLSKLEKGEIDILVGTHAIIQSDVEFKELALVVTDEQHRFGVNQRVALSNKGRNANVLVMTATPIPRTLAVILYGDLDISVIKNKPVGRKPIRTFLRNDDARENIYNYVAQKVKEGKQCYVVCPLIEESDSMDLRSAEEVYKELNEKYKKYGIKVGLLHGAMKQVEKDEIMEAFANRNIHILVSTVVIEVGIDVPNATIMVIENCERFGLAQLHQLRGRVGRGEDQSDCILICSNDSKIAHERNQIMVESSDGFYISEKDLELRGPGEIFGTKQHGLPPLNVADLVKHVDILEDVKKVAEDIIKNDPNLSMKKHKVIRKKVVHMFGESVQLNL